MSSKQLEQSVNLFCAIPGATPMERKRDQQQDLQSKSNPHLRYRGASNNLQTVMMVLAYASVVWMSEENAFVDDHVWQGITSDEYDHESGPMMARFEGHVSGIAVQHVDLGQRAVSFTSGHAAELTYVSMRESSEEK